MTEARYRAVAAWVSARPWAYRLLRLMNTGLPLLSYLLYPLLLFRLAAARDERFWRVLAVPAAAFFICTLFRHLVRAERPYEKLGIEPLIRRAKTGDSFPSRHTTCAAVIAMSYWFVGSPVSIVLFAATAGIAVTRVAAGIHFPRDVLAGGLLGLLCGALGFWRM